MQKDWKEKLHDWSPEPPEKGWERLSEALPHEAQPLYAQKLYEYAPPPPPAVFDAVVNDLNKEQTAPAVIQMYPRKRWLQVASIAASILLAVYFLPPLFKTGQQPTATAPAPPLQQSILPVTGTDQTQEKPHNEEEVNTRNGSELEEAAVQFAQIPLPPKNSDPLPVATTERAASVIRSWLPESEGVQHVGNLMERYIVLAVADDAAVRLPKKMYAAFRCDDLPNPAGCLERLAALRRQMAAPEQLASSDFLGMMEVVKNMGAAQSN